MNTKQSTLIFLRAFNTGTCLTLISMVELLMKSESHTQYIAIFMMILVNGLVIGLVTQFLSFQNTVTRNLLRTFLKAKRDVPTRLLRLKNYDMASALYLIEQIKFRTRRHMIVGISLLFLLAFSLLLPILYSWKHQGYLTIFIMCWSSLILGRCYLRLTILLNHSRCLIKRTEKCLKRHAPVSVTSYIKK